MSLRPVVDHDGLVLKQPDRGYRYSLDPFLLAGFCRPRSRERVLDLGAGVGVIGLVLAARHRTLSVTAVELQPDLADHAVENARASGLAARYRMIQGDVRDAASCFAPEHFHRIVSNPPYRRPGSGAVSPDAARARARQEHSFSLVDLARTAATLVRFGGALDLIHLAERLPDIFRALCAAGLEPKRLRLVAPFAAAAPRLCLLEAVKGGRPGLIVQPQLVVHTRPGHYTDEVAVLLSAARQAGGPPSSKPAK